MNPVIKYLRIFPVYKKIHEWFYTEIKKFIFDYQRYYVKLYRSDGEIATRKYLDRLVS